MLLHKPTDGALDNLDDEYALWIRQKAKEVSYIYYDGIKATVAHLDAQGFSNEELLDVWELLNSKIRSAYKDQKEYEKKCALPALF